MMNDLDQFHGLDVKAINRVSGRAWDEIRGTVAAVHRDVTAASPTVANELTTVYIKYTSNETKGRPFAVLWIKSSSAIVLGLSLADELVPPCLADPQPPKYKGLTAFLRFTADDCVPSELAEWCLASHRRIAGEIANDRS